MDLRGDRVVVGQNDTRLVALSLADGSARTLTARGWQPAQSACGRWLAMMTSRGLELWAKDAVRRWPFGHRLPVVDALVWHPTTPRLAVVAYGYGVGVIEGGRLRRWDRRRHVDTGSWCGNTFVAGDGIGPTRLPGGLVVDPPGCYGPVHGDGAGRWFARTLEGVWVREADGTERVWPEGGYVGGAGPGAARLLPEDGRQRGRLDLVSGEVTWTTFQELPEAGLVASCGDGGRIAMAWDDGTVGVWGGDGRRLRRWHVGEDGQVRCASLTPSTPPR